ncbi:MAG: succinate dehydrogenase, hydrophobic membrane anchor protein [Chloroherpetonaceae bacterium]|nr:succinate dehydrogenase, hydrophobic membrane anchor protein [Chloroherpetonaceae bacterium]
MQNRSAKKSGAFGWFMQRVSGVLLLATLIGHFWVQHMPTDYLSNPEEFRKIREAYMEKSPEYKAAVEAGTISDARKYEHVITYEKVTSRLSNPLWKIFDLLFLVFGLYHGFNGLLNIIDDYVKKTGLRLTLVASCWILGISLFLLGAQTVLTAGVYQPPMGITEFFSSVSMK